jgi:hypothetical protein
VFYFICAFKSAIFNNEDFGEEFRSMFQDFVSKYPGGDISFENYMEFAFWRSKFKII